MASRSTTPTTVPTMSSSPSTYTPGISAVSPPSRATPSVSQARAAPVTKAATVSGTSLPIAT